MRPLSGPFVKMVGKVVEVIAKTPPQIEEINFEIFSSWSRVKKKKEGIKFLKKEREMERKKERIKFVEGHEKQKKRSGRRKKPSQKGKKK